MYSYYSRKFDSGFSTSIMTSQVEISSRSPFGNVLKDRGRGDLWGRDRPIQKNLKNLVESRVPPKPKESNVDSVRDSCIVDSADKNDKDKKNQKISKGSEKWARAREMMFETETSPGQSDSGEIRKIRVVSSLVQKWRDFEAESKNVNKNNSNSHSCNNNSSVCSSRSNSSSVFSENSTITEGHSRNSDVPESCGPKTYEKPTITVDTNFDSESDRISISGPPSTRSRDSNAAENERNRVAEIIKRLTTMNGEESHDRDQTVSSDSLSKVRTDHSPKSGGSAVLTSPRIRGRHALNDLLMQMERDRYREIQGLGARKVVSKFPHCCRIKTLLRVRFLRQGIDVKDGSKSSPTESEKTKQGSSITHLRERFNTEQSEAELSPRKNARKFSASNQHKLVVDHIANATKLSISNQHKGKTHPQEITQPGSPLHRKVVDGIQEMVTCSASNRKKIDMSRADLASPHQNNRQLQTSKNGKKESIPSSDLMWKRTSYELKRLNTQELADTAASLGRFKGTIEEERMARKHESIASLDDWIKEISPPRSDLEDHQEAGEGHLVESGPDWTSDFSQNPSEWEEEEASTYQQEENNQEWIYDIARPQSDWEGLRQERYQEMLDPFVENGDIKQLLERRSVSTFLTSEKRDKIDQIMMSRSQVKPRVIANRVGKKMHEKENNEKRLEHKKIEEEEENKSSVGHCEAAEYFEQTPSSLCSASPPVYSSWARNPIHSPTDESVSAPSSIEQSPLSISCTRDNKLSLEMELIYGLKGHVEQIHQEIADLRRALTTCINMQVQSQNFMKPGHADSFIQSAAHEKGNVSLGRTPRKGICCLCFESEVDSLLYRCGHMCTCFKCAQELQWESGKCPICRASIQDVVRTYPDYRVRD